MIILGIDPGLAIVGYGVIEAVGSRMRPLCFGSIQTPAHTKVEDRLVTIGKQLDGLIRKYAPGEMAIEELFFNSNHTTAIAVAEARGVLLEHAAAAGLRIFEYTPLQVKQSVVGYGRAEKKQVIHMVRRILGIGEELKLDDTADALAIAICHANTSTSLLKPYFNLK